MRNQRERGSRRKQGGTPTEAQPSVHQAPQPSWPDQAPTMRYAAPPAYPADDVMADEMLPSLDEPMTTPATTAKTLVSSPGISRSPRDATAARRAMDSVSGPTLQSQELVPLKTGSERDRALAAVNAASDTPTTLIPGARKYRRPAMTVVPRRSGPRSAVTQFAVSMIVTAMLISALTLSTPLGQAAALDVSSPARAYANAAPWVPTPTPTPKPKPVVAYRPPAGANPGQQAVINDIVYVFGSYAQSAVAVAKCESDYNPNAWNSYPILNSHASGVFQILYPSTWNTTSYASSSPFNADANIHAAYQIFQRDGYSWREWQCQP